MADPSGPGDMNSGGGPDGPSGSDGRIIQADLRNEMSRSYLEYAMSVIVGRALPDARDGLKPVHRRILYAMYELGLTSDRPYRKCARVVGEVLGKYHPHGDTAVYDALVRMAQDFSMRMPLIDGHGNFGSVDNDPPAAMRYTESRLQALTTDSLLEDIESETVDFVDNFDGIAAGTHGDAGAHPPAAAQRLHRHRRGDGHQHPSPQPHRADRWPAGPDRRPRARRSRS